MTLINEKMSIVLDSASDKKALDIVLLNISKLTTISDYFVICSGNSERQVKAIADVVEEKMLEAGYKVYNKEGYKTARWILLDFGDVVVHVFHKEDREFYNLERLWVDSENIDISNFI